MISIFENNIKKLVLPIFLLASAQQSFSQSPAHIDPLYIDSLINRSNELNELYLDSSILIAENAVNLSRQINYPSGEANAFDRLGYFMDRKGKFEKGIEYYSKALKIKIQFSDISIAWTLLEIGYCYNVIGKPDSALKYFQKGVDFGKKYNGIRDIALGTFRIGALYQSKGNLQKAMSLYEESLRIGEQGNELFIIVQCLMRISAIYHQLEDFGKAIEYGNRSIDVANALNDNRMIAAVHLRLGRVYMSLKDYDKAKDMFIYALKTSGEIQHQPGLMSAYIGLGDLQMELKQFDNALENYKNANKYSTNMKAVSDQAVSLNKMGNAHFEKKNFRIAVSLGKNSFGLAQSIEAPFLQMNAAELLWKAYRGMKDYENALTFHELFKALADSVSSSDFEKSLVEKEMMIKQVNDSLSYVKEQQHLIAEQEKKDIRQRNIRNSIIAGLAGALIFLLVVYRQRNKISKARKRSDELLLNILPEEVAEELKAKGSAEAKQFDDVTVMFTDFKGFTQISEKLSPKELVSEIDACFKAFDNIISKHNIEKIKTIGDSYMCAGGLPVVNNSHAEDVVNAALEIQKFMFSHLQQRENEGKVVFEIRIGIHTGPVVAGIVGVKKFAYDIWGDTVNIASRMESSGEAGKVNISGSTYELVKNKFTCTHRGKIQAKGKGEIDMYFIEYKS